MGVCGTRGLRSLPCLYILLGRRDQRLGKQEFTSVTVKVSVVKYTSSVIPSEFLVLNHEIGGTASSYKKGQSGGRMKIKTKARLGCC